MEIHEQIETERLILKILDESATDIVLEFLLENRHDFVQYEAYKKELFFTKLFQEYVLKTEYEAIMKKGYLRYYIFEKCNPDKVIGTVSFGHMEGDLKRKAQIGYKMAVAKKNQGFGTEAVLAACYMAKEEFDIFYLDAYVMEENLPSIRLLEKCGFSHKLNQEKFIKVNNIWKNHYLYSTVLE